MALSDLIIPSEELFLVALLELEFCIEIESLLDLELELEETEMDFGLTEEPEAEILLVSGISSSSEESKRLLLDGFDGFLANGCLDGFELGLLNRKKSLISSSIISFLNVNQNRKTRKSMEEIVRKIYLCKNKLQTKNF